MTLRILSLFGLLALSQAASIDPYFDPRIVNGRDAKVGEIPYQVSLQTTDSSFHFCGGSVLNEGYVITAAHCVQGKAANSIKVIAGTIDLLDPKSVHEVQEIIVHEKYDPSDSWTNDIALLRVKKRFVRSDTIGFVTLPPRDHVTYPKDIAVVSGWGRLWQGGPTTNKLQRVDIFIADQDACRTIYERMGYNVRSNQVCANDQAEEKGSCHGDSGGPLTVKGVLTGLVSWANGCASTTYPTVYTRVSAHYDWIMAKAV